MTLTADFSRIESPPTRSGVQLSGRKIARLTIGLAALLGAFVIREPAPYEIFLAAAMALFLLFGLRLSKISLSLAALFVMFNAGGLISMLTMSNYDEVPLYLAVSLFLAFSSVFWCAVIEADMGNLRVIMRGYLIGAVITALLGIAGYFSLFPGSGVFTRYDRAMGAFQDPNVFGPFLVVPALYLLHGLLHRSVALAPIRLFFLLIIALGIFLSFSRAAWGLLVISGAIYYALTLMTETEERDRARLVVLGALGIGAFVLAMVVALQFEAVYSMFEERAKLVQSYDGAEFGRFARHAIGFQWAIENPLGIGPLEFGKLLGEDTHNIWLKAFMAYGWLGFFAWVAMVLATLVGGARLLGRNRPWRPYLFCAWSAFVGHLLIAWVIDIDHWRHVYLIIGMIWGCIALEARHQRELASAARLSNNSTYDPNLVTRTA